MAIYLITGESGTGKSSVAKELRRRGYLAYDADRESFKPITEHLEHYAQLPGYGTPTGCTPSSPQALMCFSQAVPTTSASSIHSLPESSS